MQTQKITLALSVQTLREARHLAVDQGVSLSKYLAMLIEEKVATSRQYQEARVRQTRLMREGLDLHTHGKIMWIRDELYER